MTESQSDADARGGVDEAAFAKLVQLLRFVDGDCREDEIFVRLRQELGGARRDLPRPSTQTERS